MFPNNTSKLDSLSRRQLISDVARYALGVSLLPAGMESVLNAAETSKTRSNLRGGGQAKKVIYLYMSGAMSQLDTFDPKPKSDVQGATGVIKTKIPGVQFSEHLTQLAEQSKKLAVVRSMSTSTGAHGPARYLLRTSYSPLATTKHPGIGSWMHKMLGRIHKELPASVQIGGGLGPGYLGAQFAPVPLGDPARGLQNTKSPSYLTDASFDKRMKLSNVFDADFRKKANTSSQVSGYDDLYSEAIGLLRSDDLKAFDLTKESPAAKEAYGGTRFGNAAMLARRLVESGVRFVEVSFGSWDHHYQLFDTLPPKAQELDKVVGTLLKDLESRGLLDETLVVIGTEFGRKPKPNQNGGRDHHPAAFSTMLAGGGIKGGQVYGATDKDAFHVEDDSVSVEDFNATIAHAVGIPHDKEIHSPDGRPFTIGNGGEPIEKLF
jgi:hypothetical protein